MQIFKLTQLTALDLSRSELEGLDTDDDLAQGLQQLQQLQVLRLDKSDSLYDPDFTRIAHVISNMPQLQVLDVSDCDNMTLQAATALVTACSLHVGMKELRIAGERDGKWSDVDLEECVDSFTNIMKHSKTKCRLINTRPQIGPCRNF